MSQISAGGNFLACRIYIGNSAGGVSFTCNYLTEDGLSAYVAENGTTFYVPEDCPGNPMPFGPAFNMIPSVLNQSGARFRII